MPVDKLRKKETEAGAVTSFFDDFKGFILRGNVLDLAVGMIMGGAFNAIVNSLVTDMILPLVSLAGPGNVLEEVFAILRYGERPKDDPSYDTRREAKEAGAITMNYGFFFQTIINFLIIAFLMFLIIKLVYKMLHKEESFQADFKCPRCKEAVKDGAVRCSHCGTEPIERPESDGKLAILGAA